MQRQAVAETLTRTLASTTRAVEAFDPVAETNLGRSAPWLDVVDIVLVGCKEIRNQAGGIAVQTQSARQVLLAKVGVLGGPVRERAINDDTILASGTANPVSGAPHERVLGIGHGGVGDVVPVRDGQGVVSGDLLQGLFVHHQLDTMPWQEGGAFLVTVAVQVVGHLIPPGGRGSVGFGVNSNKLVVLARLLELVHSRREVIPLLLGHQRPVLACDRAGHNSRQGKSGEKAHL
mmetsp:Transcript_21596/g.24016  ORF Transcript_21596/g.24016 Transcript_21596/m.24016 type:complete len:233 (+) Transcript_21596:437-1135(+)